MLSLELRQSIAEFFSRSSEYEPLFDAIRRIGEHFDQSAPYILGQAEGGNKLNEAASALQSRFTSLHSVTAEIVPSQIYQSFGAFKAGLSSAFHEQRDSEKFLKSLEAGVGKFVDDYDTYLRRQTPANAAQLLMRSSEANRLIETSLGALRFAETTMGGERSQEGIEAELSLVIYEVESVPDFAGKLDAIQKLYSELCMLLRVSEAEHPLRIGKIESGSLWVKVIGDTKITQLMGELLASMVRFLHRNYTNEGQIEAVPKKLESLDAAISLSSKLKAIGVDTAEMDEHLRKSGVAISKSLATLLDGQPKVRLNDQLYTVAASNDRLSLEQRKTLLLRNGAARIEPTLDGVPDES